MTIDHSTELPGYWEVADCLAVAALPMSPSQLHGRLCGYIAAANKADGFAWLETLLRAKQAQDEAPMEARDTFLNLYRYSFSHITQMDFSFALLLPIEDESIEERAAALGEWCHGFIQGLQMLGIEIDTAQTEELRDALFHIEEISRLDYDNLSITEEDERCFVEVYEYVRMAVLSLYAELGGAASKAVAQLNDGNETVH